jgi:glycosyltransferase involved in cell wall biosynthesis/Flp pilus assembly protein TadD/2-polyprenyl-3-methyl-5-hydroxy-6-metoxy-1,4-benzoquinol methylase
VVTSDIEPMSEYIVHGESGILVKECADPIIMSAAIRSACEDVDLRAEIKPRARRAARPFSKDTIDALEVGLYRQFLESASHAAAATNNLVNTQIRQQNPWYVGKQFEWAEKASIRPIYQKRYEFFARVIRKQQEVVRRPIRLLDAGCGDGYWLHRLSDIDGVECTGIDYNPLRVERARTAAPFAEIHQGDLLSLSGEKRFDVILLNQVIEHVQDDGGLMQTVKGLLSPGGVLILGTPNEGSPLHQLRNARLGPSFQTDHVHFYTEADIRKTIARAGFRVDTIMREVFCIGDDERYYQLLEQEWGFRLLEFMTFLVPTECSDYYFECSVADTAAEPSPETLTPSVPPLTEIKQQLDEFINTVRPGQPGTRSPEVEFGTVPASRTPNTSEKQRHRHYLSRLPVYRVLTEADLHDPAVRMSEELASRLRNAGMVQTDLTNYWKRVSFISEHVHGRVLEIGAACGNITRYIAANPDVTYVYAVDQQPEYIAQLNQYGFPKVKAVCADLRTYSFNDRFDCVVMGELIEHLTLEEEQAMVTRLRSITRPGASFIITTPIGFMPDPDHVRGFSQEEFGLHVQRLYGSVVTRGDNGIQQFAVARVNDAEIPQESPRISIVLPTYNNGSFLPHAVESVLAQSYRDLELIIVDDASTDGTDRYLQGLSDPRVRIITHERNKRLPASLNDGLRAARGELLTWISADNFCYPHFVETLVAALDADPDAGIAVSSFAWINESGERTRITSGQDFSLPRVIAMNPGNASFMYRSTVQDRIGWYDEELEGAEDWDMWVRIVEEYPAICVQDILYDYREHRQSMTAQKKEQVARASTSVFLKTFSRWNREFPVERLYPSVAECDDPVLARAHASFDFGTLLLRSPFADPGVAAAFLKHACAYKPDFLAATCNLAVARIRCGDRESAEALAGTLEQVNHPTVQALVEGIHAGSSYEVLPLFLLDSRSSELLRREESRKRSFSPVPTRNEDRGTLPPGAISAVEEADRLRREGLFDEALAGVVEAAARYPDAPGLANLIGEIHLERNDRIHARRVFSVALEQWPDNTELHNNLAVVEILEGNIDRAVDHLQQVLDRDPADETARANLAYLRQQCGVPEAGEEDRSLIPDGRYDEAVRLASEGRNDEAIALLEQVIAARADHAPAHNDLGALLFSRGESKRALEHLKMSLRLDPTNRTTMKNLADFHIVAGSMEKGALLHQQVLNLDPNDVESLMSLGAIAAGMQRYEDARWFFTKILELEPHNTEVTRRLAGIDRAPSPEGKSGLLRQRAVGLVQQGNLVEAGRVFRQITEVEPDSPDAFFNLGISLHTTGDVENGIAALVRALELDPSNVATAKTLAHVLLQADRFGEGLKLLAGILSLAPDDTEVLVGLAAIYRTVGRNADADLFLARARRIDPDVVEPAGILEHTASPDPGDGSGGDLPLSFCIITAGKREHILQTVIASIHAQAIPEYEIIVVGNFHDVPGITYVPAEEKARTGRLGAMRNAALQRTRYDNVVILDDDIVLSPDWYEELRQHGDRFEILTSQVRLPDGGRYWDHASFGGPRGQVILNPDEEDEYLYMTGGGGWLVKRALWQEIQWNEGLGFYRGEDIEYAARLRERGYRIAHNHRSIVYHADPVYTTIGRMVVRRNGGKSVSWVREVHGESGTDQIIHSTRLHLQKGEVAEAADCLRFAISRFPDESGILQAWNTLELQFGGRLNEACWFFNGDPGYRETMSRFMRVAEVSAPLTEPVTDAGSAQVLWHAPVFNPSGYADEARNFVLGLESHGMPVALRVISNHSPGFYENMNPDLRAKLDRSLSRTVNAGCISIVHFPAYAFQRVPGASYCIGRTMFESDGLPPDWVAACNAMDEVWVPTEFNLETFRRAGVKVPLVKVPGGIDVDHYRPGYEPMKIPGTRGTVFLSVFEWTYRKGWDILLKAWAQAFSAADEVSLVLRTSPMSPGTEMAGRNEIEARIGEFFRQNGIQSADVAPIVVLGEPIHESHLPQLYAAASAYVAPSRGEGWGRPQMEAMACGVPVIATRWSGSLEFMNDENSLLIDVQELRVIDDRAEIPFYRGQRWAEPDTRHLVALLQKVFHEPECARAIGVRARSDMENHWQWNAVTKIALRRITEVREQIRKQNGASTKEEDHTAGICWEGAQFVHHSLAGINRQICSGLIAGGHEVSVIPTEKDTFAPPVRSPLRNVLDRMNKDLASVDIHVRHHWPPNLDPPERGRWVVIQPWEFGSLPKKWVEVFSRQVDEMWVYSTYVRDVYVGSGVPADRVAIIPCGIDPAVYHRGVKKYRLQTKKRFRFLFVGGTIFRKGIDILLGAYARTFTAADDVCLVIKDMGGDSFYRGQTFREEIEAVIAKPDAPAIEYIDRMLDEHELAGLYTACDVLVHPYRGEGFGLPILESMACGTPAIVTDGGAARDFCNSGNSLLVKAEQKRYSEKRISTYETVDYPWLYEVEIPDLAEQMEYAFRHRKELRILGIRAAEDAAQWTWAHSVAAVEARIERLRNKPVVREQQITTAGNAHPAEGAYLRALARYRAEQYREALEDLKVAQSHLFQRGLPPDSVTEFDVAMRRGDCLVKLGMLQEAKIQYEQALQIDPLSADACYNLGLCFELAGLPEPACTMYRCAVDIKPEWEQARAKIRLLDQDPGVGVPEQENHSLIR